MSDNGGHVGAPDPALPKSATVPGSRVSTLRVPAFLNSMPRWLLKTPCGLRGFLLSMLRSPSVPLRDATSTASASTWPMPVPYPEVFRKPRASEQDSLWQKRLICLQVVLLDWFVLGKPAVAPPGLALGAKLTARQWSAVSVMRHVSFDGNFPEFIDADLMGRGAAKIESFEDAIASFHRAFLNDGLQVSQYFGGGLTKPDIDFPFDQLTCGRIVGRMPKMNVSPAKEIEADRIDLPAPPKFNPVPLLDDQTAYVYQHPIQASISLPVLDAGPVVHVRATRDNKLRLLRKLALSGRLQPLHCQEVRTGHLSGLFAVPVAVPKNQTKDRLILDARPANQADVALNRWCKSMASASILSDLSLEDHQVLAASGEDLRDFFYQFKVSKERTLRNALADPLTLEEAKQVFDQDMIGFDEPVYCGLATLAMGDQNACEFAQCSHLSLMLRSGVLTEDEMLSLQGDIPRGPICVGVIIDDLVLLEKLLMSDLAALREGRLRTAADDKVEAALAGYNAQGLEVNLKKEFRNDMLARFWGIELDGHKGIVRGSTLRMWPLAVITLRVAMLGFSSVTLLEAIAGSWVSLFAVRRRFLCSMNIIFEAIGISDQALIIKLSPELKSELWGLALLGPLAACNLRAKHTSLPQQMLPTGGLLPCERVLLCRSCVRPVAAAFARASGPSSCLQTRLGSVHMSC